MPARKGIRFLAALAMITVPPAALSIEAELASRGARSGFLQQTQQFDKTIGELRQRSISCNKARTDVARLSRKETVDLIWGALDATRDVNCAFTRDTLFWSFEKGLPWTAGLYSVYHASGSAQDHLAHLTREPDLCRRVPDGDNAKLREEEQRSQAWLNEQRLKIEELYNRLTVARAAYEQDRPKLAALAWSLGVLQVVGWGLLYLVILPQEMRAWRKRRAERKGRELKS